ncbi:hypothetical protein Asp14428_10580 [Actinoplanes sp. NBRC 14428]|nr:hypothetical protein Asp14428_10580 [Actinoplanes sp. NBRC 14428]
MHTAGERAADGDRAPRGPRHHHGDGRQGDVVPSAYTDCTWKRYGVPSVSSRAVSSGRTVVAISTPSRSTRQLAATLPGAGVKCSRASSCRSSAVTAGACTGGAAGVAVTAPEGPDSLPRESSAVTV